MPHSPKARKILITGASGFVGQYLVAHLRGLQSDVAVAGQDGGFDIRDAAAVTAAVRAARPAAVIHLAAVAAPAVARADPRQAWDVNVTGTFNLAQAVMQNVPEATFVFVGSSESYGLQFNAAAGPLGEDAAFAPVNAYGATKAAADLMIGQMARDGLRAVRLRPFNHTGPGQEPAYVVADFARQIAQIEACGGEGEMRVGNLDAARDFLDVRDVVRAYAAAAMADDLVPGVAINVARGEPQTIRAVLDQLVGLSRASIRIAVDPARLRANDIAVASGDPARARALLGWQPQMAWSQTLADVLDAYRGEAASHGR